MKIFLLCLVVLMACKSGNQKELSEDTSGAVYSDTLNSQSGSEETSFVDDQGSAIEFVNDEIGGNPFNGDLPSILTSIGNYDVLKKSFQNLHDSTLMDTLMTFNFGPSMIEYFQGNNNGFIISANIESDKVEFKKGIRIGMGETEFNSMFDELSGRKNLQMVTISTLEGLAYTEFLFANRKLAAIKYQSYFD